MHTCKTIIAATLIAIMLVLTSCNRENSVEQLSGQTITYPSLTTEVDLTITVQTTAGNPIDDVDVSIGAQLETTDANGIARMKDVTRTSLGYTVKISHPSYLPETILLPYDPAELDLQKTVRLTSKEVSRLTSGMGGGSTNEGSFVNTSLVIDDNNANYQQVSGTPYSGPVTYHGYLTFGGNNAISQSLPIRVHDSGGTSSFVPQVSLRIEAYDNTGALLQLVDGTTLEVTIANLAADDVEDRSWDMIYMDVATGLHSSQPSVSSSEGLFNLRLSKTGIYQIGDNRNSVLINLILHTSNSIPVANIPLTVQVGSTLSKVGTDAVGRLSAEVPEGEQVHLLVDICSVAENLDLGSFSADTDLGIVELAVPGSPIIGTVWDCESPEDMLGYVAVNQEQVGLLGPDGVIVGTWLCTQDSSLIQLLVTNTISGNSTQGLAFGDLSGTPIDLGQVTLPCDLPKDLCGTVRYDEDDDGIAESTSASGVRFGDLVQLTGPILAGNIAASPVYFAPIEADGSYCFTELAPGQYELKLNYVDPTADYQYSGVWQPVQTASGAASLMISIGGNPVYDVDIQYNEIVPGSISGSIFWDTNNDGIGDLPHDGLKVWLQSDRNRDGIPDGEVSSTVPNAQGEYRFDNVINTAYVLEVRPVGDEVISGRDDSPDDAFEVVDDITNDLIPVFLQRGEVDTDNNYILRFESTASTASISGKILIDTDGDGVGDIGYREEFILLNHRDEDGLPTSGTSFEEQVALTAIDGSFSFDNIPEGEYVLTSTGNIEGPNGFGVFTRVSDKDESPEPGEVLDTAPANGHILVDLPANGQDSDNIFVIRF